MTYTDFCYYCRLNPALGESMAMWVDYYLGYSPQYKPSGKVIRYEPVLV